MIWGRGLRDGTVHFGLMFAAMLIVSASFTFLDLSDPDACLFVITLFPFELAFQLWFFEIIRARHSELCSIGGALRLLVIGNAAILVLCIGGTVRILLTHYGIAPVSVPFTTFCVMIAHATYAIFMFSAAGVEYWAKHACPPQRPRQ